MQARRKILAVSIIGCDRFAAGYNAAKVAHEQAILSGPIPAQVLRAAQFHELVALLVDWGRQGDVSYVPRMRTQPVAARTVAWALADLTTGPGSAPEPGSGGAPIAEIAGPREENLIEMAALLAAWHDDRLRIEGVSDQPTPTVSFTKQVATCPARTPPSPAQRSRSGSTRHSVSPRDSHR